MKHLIQLFLFLYFLTYTVSAFCQGRKSVIWNLNDTLRIGGIIPVVIGNPKLEKDEKYTYYSFNGDSDGFILPLNPINNLKKFTVEVLFKPSYEGNREQRFVHFQDKSGNRGLIEIRLEEGQWWLDTYLHVGASDRGLTLVDRTRRHPCDQWYWAALVYDGKIMKHYLNGDEELSGEINFGPMESGIISLGVRLNQVFWFKGNIGEIRFHPKSLKKKNLQKIN